jgi:hypothetical protein
MICLRRHNNRRGATLPIFGCSRLSAELAQLVEVERNELLDLKHVDPVRQAGIVREALRDGQAALPSDENGAKAVVEIVPATLDHRLAWRRGDVNGDIAEEKVSAPAGLLIRGFYRPSCWLGLGSPFGEPLVNPPYTRLLHLQFSDNGMKGCTTVSKPGRSQISGG